MPTSSGFRRGYASHHPTYRFNDVRVPGASRVGEPGDGMAYTHSWFRHERLMTYEAARAADRGESVKALHSRCSMVKLFVSEAANRIADRAVQIFGGRGYMRENVAERFFRELRVDRIWEGTSEIQRLIIARSLIKRGLSDM